MALAWTAGDAVSIKAGPTPSMVELSMQVDGGAGARCSTQPGDSTVCRVGVGERFTVAVNLDDFALPDADLDTTAGYTGFAARVYWTGGLTIASPPIHVNNLVTWPDCDIIGSTYYSAPLSALLACAIGPGQNESVFLGRMGAIDLNCSTNLSVGNTVSAPNGPDALDGLLVSDENDALINDDEPAEGLQVDCLFIWDTTEDGVVSVGDIGFTVSHFGQTVPPAAIEADVDGDGVVSVGDIGEVVAHFGEMAPP